MLLLEKGGGFRWRGSLEEGGGALDRIEVELGGDSTSIVW